MIVDKPNKSQIENLRILWREAFGDTDEFLDTFFKTAFSYDRCACISAGGGVLASLYWFDCLCLGEKTAYIYAVATAKAYRNKGLCKKLMEYTHKKLADCGYKCAALVPGEKSLFEFYEKIGYKTFGYIDQNEYRSGTGKIKIERIDKNEYAKVRRKFLPEGGIVQERENLDFLMTQAEFYKGDGFVLASRGEKNSLYGIEFLGNTNIIPDVLNTLGYNCGIIRTPGKGREFAMYYPLNEGIIPKYFGLAFD